MFRRLINNNVQNIGVRRLSNDNNNHKIIQQIDEVNRTLNYIYKYIYFEYSYMYKCY